MAFTTCRHCGDLAVLVDESCPRCSAELLDGARPLHPNLASNRLPPIPSIDPFNGIGSVLGPTISLFSHNFWFITKLVFVLFAPFEIIRVLKFGAEQGTWEGSLGVAFLGLICNVLIAPSLNYGLFMKLQNGTTPSLHACYRWGLSRLPKYILCSIIVGILTVLGLIALVVPGIILIVAFVPVTPLASLESHGPIDVLQRSLNLTRGHRGAVFVALVCIMVLAYLIKLPLEFVMSAGGVPIVPLQILVAIIADILDQATTVFALVTYVALCKLGLPRSNKFVAVER